MPPLDHLRRFGREAVERVRGQGENVNFRHRSEAFARDHSVPFDHAQKEVWSADLRRFETELRLRGQFQLDLWERCNAGLEEMFAEADLAQFRADAEDPAFVRPLTPPAPRPRDVRRLEQRYQREYGERYVQAPLPTFELEEIAQHFLIMQELSNRVLSDAALSSDSMQDLISANPEIGADLGQIFARIEEVRRRERGMERSMETHAAIAEGRQAIANLLFEPVRCFIDTNVHIFRAVQSGNPMHFLRAFERIVTMVGREVGSASRIVLGMVRLLGSVRN